MPNRARARSNLRGGTSTTLLLARDRCGITALYVAEGPWGIAFASELKALHETLPTERVLDWEALDMYLQLGYIPAPRTPFRDIRKLEPGHTATWHRSHETLPTERVLDWEALDMYLQLGYIPAPRTPFRDIRKLEPGHTATWHRSR